MTPSVGILGQTVKMKMLTSQVSQDGDYDRARFVGGSDDGDSEEELELYDTYNHPD